jgi:hypothetical protein
MSLHCSTEYHLAKLKSRLAAPIYSLALRLSKRSGVFSASLLTLAAYFNVGYATVKRAVRELIRAGFFDIQSQEFFAHTTYHVVKHELWAKLHPGTCIPKIAHSASEDQLGMDMYAVSGRRVKLYHNHLIALRETGLDDQAIVAEWRKFLDADMTCGTQWKSAFYRFLRYLRSALRDAPPNRYAPENLGGAGSAVAHGRATTVGHG